MPRLMIMFAQLGKGKCSRSIILLAVSQLPFIDSRHAIRSFFAASTTWQDYCMQTQCFFVDQTFLDLNNVQ